MYMWNQVNYTQNYYANVGTSTPYNQWSYPLVLCPHQLLWFPGGAPNSNSSGLLVSELLTIW
jgi:hypothetical protein